jgi:hypothetical protein
MCGQPGYELSNASEPSVCSYQLLLKTPLLCESLKVANDLSGKYAEDHQTHELRALKIYASLAGDFVVPATPWIEIPTALVMPFNVTVRCATPGVVQYSMSWLPPSADLQAACNTSIPWTQSGQSHFQVRAVSAHGVFSTVASTVFTATRVKSAAPAVHLRWQSPKSASTNVSANVSNTTTPTATTTPIVPQLTGVASIRVCVPTAAAADINCSVFWSDSQPYTSPPLYRQWNKLPCTEPCVTVQYARPGQHSIWAVVKTAGRDASDVVQSEEFYLTRAAIEVRTNPTQ